MKIHGNDVTTEIIDVFTNKKECKEFAIKLRKFAIRFRLENKIIERKQNDTKKMVLLSLERGILIIPK